MSYPANKWLYSFLPYTVNFDAPRKQSPEPLVPRETGRPDVGSLEIDGNPTLFPKNLDSAGFTPPITPVAPVQQIDQEKIFLPYLQQGRSRDASYIHLPNPLDPLSLAPTDPHSPAWGEVDSFNQPKSRADSPPPASILKPIRTREQAASLLWKASNRFRANERIRNVSHERSFSDSVWTVQPAALGNGGLKNAVKAAVDSGYLREKTWVGTLGMPTDALDDHVKSEIAEKLEDEFDSVTVFVCDKDFNGHYSHYCKTILWPIFHYQIPDNPKSKAYEDHSWVYYVKVNEAFADRVTKNWKRGDIIWIHDYHLLLVPSMVRKLLPDAQIGFFMHVAFPSSEVFRCLAVRKELLEGVLGANLIGFQTQEYCHHFLQTCSRLLNVEATKDGIQLEDRFVNVGTFPIGIDPKALKQRREEKDVDEWIRIIQKKYKGKRLIVARDKLDHIRGVRQKLLSYELFLKSYPEWKEKVVLIQVALSSTEQAELDAAVSDIVTRINSDHSTLTHQPLVFLKQDIGYSQYLALLTVADALFIMSMREGMNLLSHEFIHCQDGSRTERKHGSLILSEFTGSADVFDGHGLLVNPWDFRHCADTVHQALVMSLEERAKRWNSLHSIVIHRTAKVWVESFVEQLSTVWKDHAMRDTASIPRLPVGAVVDKYQAARKRLFLLDYEGTLASWGDPCSIVLTTPQRAIDVLNSLLECPKNIVYVMSGRMPEEMERLFRRVPGLGLIAENGCYLMEADTDEWIPLTDEKRVKSWKQGVRSILKYYEERIEGSKMHERRCSIALDYSEAKDMDAATKQASECTNHINDACASQRIHAIPAESALVVEPADITKASAAEKMFAGIEQRAKRGGTIPEFLFVAGDSREDEFVFQWANKLGKSQMVRDVVTVTLGSRNTAASATLTQKVTGRSVSLLKNIVC